MSGNGNEAIAPTDLGGFGEAREQASQRRCSARLRCALYCEAHGVAAAAAVMRVAGLLEAVEAQDRSAAIDVHLVRRAGRVPAVAAVQPVVELNRFQR